MVVCRGVGYEGRRLSTSTWRSPACSGRRRTVKCISPITIKQHCRATLNNPSCAEDVSKVTMQKSPSTVPYNVQETTKTDWYVTAVFTRRSATLSSQLRDVSTIGKNLLSSNASSTSSQYGELRPTNGWDRLTSLGHPCKFQLGSRLGSVTARHLVMGVSQTLQHWTEGATYIRQGGHHVGHWPAFLVSFIFLL